MNKKFYQDLKIGVLGGGQLGRMLIQEAINLNLNVQIMDADAEAPCKHLVSNFIVGQLTDYQSVMNFAKELDLLTIEIENVNIEALFELEKMGVVVYPQPKVIKLIQDKRVQKQFYIDNQIPTSDFVLINHKSDLDLSLDMLPAFLKLGKAGYDGKGVMLLSNKNDFNKAFESPSLLEKKVDFEKEISVIISRNKNGEISFFPTIEMVFDNQYNLVDYIFSPAQISKEIEEKAVEIAKNIIQKLDMIGILAVEMFVTKDGNVLVNEIAPRPHNSGHHTIEANFTSQYAMHWRAILNLPLGSCVTRTHAAMVNLLGEDGFNGIAKYDGLENILKIEGVYPHLYGKKFTKPSRKMGHVTIIDNDIEKLKQKVILVKNTIKVIA
ncbi:MAG: 5-(carboxyamino)imidazole ribonucleotide synthase [Cytophagales bacterium]|nr:MAG: 5-(carboxyamino)imidazole ribonucleotide synthase [Cytophagales bacterium]